MVQADPWPTAKTILTDWITFWTQVLRLRFSNLPLLDHLIKSSPVGLFWAIPCWDTSVKHGSRLVSGLLRWYGVLENTASLSTAWNFSPNVVIRKYYIPCLSETSVSSAAQSCLTLCDPMDCSTPGFPVHHQLPEFTQTHVHWVGDAIQPSHPLSASSPPVFNLSQHQSLFQWVGLHQEAKVLEFQLQYQSFQWTLRTDLL